MNLQVLLLLNLLLKPLRPDHPTEKFRIEAAGGTVTMEAAVSKLRSVIGGV